MSEVHENLVGAPQQSDVQIADRFAGRLNSDDTYDHVAGVFRQNFGIPKGRFVVQPKLRVAYAKEADEYGVVSVVNGTADDPDRIAVVTHPNFPEFIEESVKLNKFVSPIDFAARYVIAFGLIQRGFRRYTHANRRSLDLRKTVTLGFDPSLWQPEFTDPRSNGMHAAPYRTAARVTMEACGMDCVLFDDIDQLKSAEYLPPQVASLINPHNKHAIERLSDIALADRDLIHGDKVIFKL